MPIPVVKGFPEIQESYIVQVHTWYIKEPPHEATFYPIIASSNQLSVWEPQF